MKPFANLPEAVWSLLPEGRLPDGPLSLLCMHPSNTGVVEIWLWDVGTREWELEGFLSRPQDLCDTPGPGGCYER